jgi:hypothetical protein
MKISRNVFRIDLTILQHLLSCLSHAILVSQLLQLLPNEFLLVLHLSIFLQSYSLFLVKKEPEHLQKSQLLHQIISIVLLFDLGTYVRLLQIINLKTLSFGHCRLCLLSSAGVILRLLVSMYESLQICREFEVGQL